MFGNDLGLAVSGGEGEVRGMVGVGYIPGVGGCDRDCDRDVGWGDGTRLDTVSWERKKKGDL